MTLNVISYKLCYIKSEINKTSLFSRYNNYTNNRDRDNISIKKLYKRCQSTSNKDEQPETITTIINEDEINTKNNELLCIGTGNEVECIIPGTNEDSASIKKYNEKTFKIENIKDIINFGILISPFFFWGTGMVTMKLLAPHTSPLFVGATRLLPAGIILLIWASLNNRRQPETAMAWFSIILFGLIDGTCFQGFLVEGLQKTSAGLGSVIIDSQPLTVAVLASFIYNEKLSKYGIIGLIVGVFGLSLLELPQETWTSSNLILTEGIRFSNIELSVFSNLWERGEWWMLLAAQSMAIGTVMVRWVSKYSDPVIATGWHMIIGSLPLLYLTFINEFDVLTERLSNLTLVDVIGLCYVFLFGGAISFGVFFDNATKGNLTKLSSLTFLTPVFATICGYLVLNEKLDNIQLIGGFITCLAVLMINSSKDN